MLFNLLSGGGAHDVIKPDIPVAPVCGVTGINDVTLDVPEDLDDVPGLNGPGLTALLWDPYHTSIPQDRFALFHCLPILTGLQLLEILASRPQISFGGVTPGNIQYLQKVFGMVISIGRPFEIWNGLVLVLYQGG